MILCHLKTYYYLCTIKHSYSYIYKANYFGGKIVYALPMEQLILTPQVGLGVLRVAGKVDQKGTGIDPNMYNTYAVSMSIGARLSYLPLRNIGLYWSPEYSFVAKSGGIYSSLIDVSSKVKRFGEGFNISVGLCIFF